MGVLDNTLGAVFIAGMLAAVLYGLTLLQTFLYTQTSTSDGWFMKALVSLLWVLDTAHMAVVACGLYSFLVTHFGHLEVLASPGWAFIVTIHLTSVTGIIVRIFFAVRISLLCGRFSRRNLPGALPVLVMIPAMVTFITGIIFGTKAFIVGTFARLEAYSPYLYVSFGSAAFADTLITICLCTLLYKNRTGIKQTDSMLTSLIIMTINTGFLTSVFTLLCLISYSAWPHRFIYVGMYFPLNKLYVNSLLGSLNVRKMLRDRQGGSTFSTDLRCTQFEATGPTYFFAPGDNFTTSVSEGANGRKESPVLPQRLLSSYVEP